MTEHARRDNIVAFRDVSVSEVVFFELECLFFRIRLNNFFHELPNIVGESLWLFHRGEMSSAVLISQTRQISNEILDEECWDTRSLVGKNCITRGNSDGDPGTKELFRSGCREKFDEVVRFDDLLIQFEHVPGQDVLLVESVA